MNVDLAREIAKLLNQMLVRDHEATQAAIETRWTCGRLLADHPTIQVARIGDADLFTVGLLGILNGLIGTAGDGTGILAAMYDGRQLTGFELLKERICSDPVEDSR